MVLPFNWEYDHTSIAEYAVPKLNNSCNKKNLAEYKEYQLISANIAFDNAMNSCNPDTIVDQLVLGFIYHPRFPETFFNFIANSIENTPTLLLENVEPFLEFNYAKHLEQPDCEYLSSILTLWSSHYIVRYPLNIIKALKWLEKKHDELPIWPALYDELDSRGKRARLHRLTNSEGPTVMEDKHPNAIPDIINVVASATIANESRSEQLVKSLLKVPKPPRESVMLPGNVRVLTKALEHFELLNEFGQLAASASPGSIAGIIRGLTKKHIVNNKVAIFTTLYKKFNFTGSLRSIQGSKIKSKTDNDYYNKTLHYLEHL
jgi:hypothetical protein